LAERSARAIGELGVDDDEGGLLGEEWEHAEKCDE
jgi:hypothetical protein